MFGLPIWAVQLIIVFLRAVGAVNLAESLSLKLFLFLKQHVENLKSYHEPSDFPSGRNGQETTDPPAINNFNKG